MTNPTVDAPFTLKRVQEMLGLSRTVVTGLITAGFVTPVRGARNEHRFSFQDLMLLRTAFALQQANIPPRKILGSLKKLKAELPGELPLAGLRITAVGADVAVREPTGHLKADSGQLLMDFEVAAVGGSVTFLSVKTSPPAVPLPASAAQWFKRAQAEEELQPKLAEESYRRALQLDPTHAYSYLNLGAMLCETKRCAEAVELYDSALAHGVDEALVHFNRAIALDDQGRQAEALESYAMALQLNPELADAHYNSAVLLEAMGDNRGAVRHYSAYRRLDRAKTT